MNTNETLNDFINRIINETTTTQKEADTAYTAYTRYIIAVSTIDRIFPAANIITTVLAAATTTMLTHNPAITTAAAIATDIAPVAILQAKAHKQNKIFTRLTGGNLTTILRTW